MRILIDCHCFDYSTSEGINTYIRGLYGALTVVARDIDFYFAAREIGKLQRIFGDAPNIHYVALAAKGRVHRLLTEIPSLVRKYGIDVAHYQYTAPLIKNCKTIVTLHDILFKDYPSLFPLSYRLTKGALFELSARRADLLLTVSEYSRRRISSHFGIPLSKIHVTPNAVSEDFFHIDAGQAREARKKHQSKGDRNKENQTQPVVNKRFCSRLPLQPNSRERQDNARFPLPSHYLFRNLPEA